jgi:hypothetical protein
MNTTKSIKNSLSCSPQKKKRYKNLLLAGIAVAAILCVFEAPAFASLQQQMKQLKGFASKDVAPTGMVWALIIGGIASAFAKSAKMFFGVIAIIAGMAYALEWVDSPNFGTSKSVIAD